MFAPALLDNGKPNFPNSAPNWASVSVGSIEIKRSRSKFQHLKTPFESPGVPQPRETETYVSRESLGGLVPAALLEVFSFWRTSSRTIVGYPRLDVGDSNRADAHSAIHILLPVRDKECSKLNGVNRAQSVHFDAGAYICRVMYGKSVSCSDPDFANIEKVEVLLDAKRCYGAIGHIVFLLTRLDDLSHLLFWSDCPDKRQPATNAIVSLSRVEMPRLQLHFSVMVDPLSNVYRLCSTDYDGMFVSQRGIDEPQLKQFFTVLDHAVCLENINGEFGLLTPNFKAMIL